MTMRFKSTSAIAKTKIKDAWAKASKFSGCILFNCYG